MKTCTDHLDADHRKVMTRSSPSKLLCYFFFAWRWRYGASSAIRFQSILHQPSDDSQRLGDDASLTFGAEAFTLDTHGKWSSADPFLVYQQGILGCTITSMITSVFICMFKGTLPNCIDVFLRNYTRVSLRWWWGTASFPASLYVIVKLRHFTEIISLKDGHNYIRNPSQNNTYHNYVS